MIMDQLRLDSIEKIVTSTESNEGFASVNDLERIGAITPNDFNNTQAFWDSISTQFEHKPMFQIMDSLHYVMGKGQLLYWYPDEIACQQKGLMPLTLEKAESINFSNWFTSMDATTSRVILELDPNQVKCSLEQLNGIHLYCSGVRGLYQPELHNWVFQSDIFSEFLFTPNVMGPHNIHAFISVTEHALTALS